MAIIDNRIQEAYNFFYPNGDGQLRPDLPETVMLNAAIKQNTVAIVVEECFEILKRGDIAPRIRLMRIGLLEKIKAVL